MENKEQPEIDKANLSEVQLLNLPESTTNYSFASQRANKGWLVWATDRNGVVTALTFMPD